MNRVIKLERVFLHCRGRCILNDMNLNINEGESFAIVGPNGAGKTKLLRLMVGLESPSAGKIEVLGRDNVCNLSFKELASLRQDIGMVFQGGSLVNRLSVLENIMLPLHNTTLSQSEMKREAHLQIVRLQLDGREHFLPHELSVGTMRIIEMARASIHNPRLLLCDGLLDGLDPAAGVEIYGLLENCKKSSNMTIIVTSRILNNISGIAHRVCILNRGHMLFVGSPQQVREKAMSDVEVKHVITGEL